MNRIAGWHGIVVQLHSGDKNDTYMSCSVE